MSQIMEPPSREPGPFEQALEGASDVESLERPAGAGAEDQSTVAPLVPRLQPRLQLRLAVELQGASTTLSSSQFDFFQL